MNKWSSRLIILNICILLLIGSFGFQFLYFYNLDKRALNQPEPLISPIMVKDNHNPQSHIAESIRNSESDSTYQYYSMERLPQNVINELKILYSKGILDKNFIQYLLDGETYIEVNEGNYSYEYNISILQYKEVVGNMNIKTEKSTGKITFLMIVSQQIERSGYNKSFYEKLMRSATHISEQIQALETSEEMVKDYIRYLGLDTTQDWVKQNEDFVSGKLDIRVGQLKGDEAYLLFAESTITVRETEQDESFRDEEVIKNDNGE